MIFTKEQAAQAAKKLKASNGRQGDSLCFDIPKGEVLVDMNRFGELEISLSADTIDAGDVECFESISQFEHVYHLV